ncbi:MAG TPA: phosphoribosylformylglycinamidine cyclo-ligase [Candidatus Kapabacteria bacterium]|nr:phosphoribosylformylglycinamidine cyclo-ligase [Candidatus Kapabacteria bacterium]
MMEIRDLDNYKNMNTNYKQAGVDIEAGEEVVRRIKPLIKRTYSQNVLSDIGLFAGFYDARFPEYKHPVLVASTDGVGTKLKIAFQMGIHNTVGHCLVNHCTNDILTTGAKPLFFLDYLGTGNLEVSTAEQVISGFVDGCLENDCALIGGETAEMPSLYNNGEYDVSGTIIGIVEKDKIITGANIKSGNFLIGLPSNGLHTNGYSLARKVLLDKFKIDEYISELGQVLGEELLKIHKSYLKIITPLLQKELISGISHITGGGIVGNTNRIIPKGYKLNINWGSWEVPPIFRMIQKTGNIDDEEMRRVFNLGIGLIIIVSNENINTAIELLKNENPIIIGDIIPE